MLRHIRLSALITALVISVSCGEGILDPGEVARPLAGLYRLESRTFVAQDSAGTILDLLTPPEVRSSLILTTKGRYGQVDTLFTNDELQIFSETGRWSVFNDELFIESDDDRFASERYTYDGLRLTRILPDLSGNVPSGFFRIVDVWRR